VRSLNLKANISIIPFLFVQNSYFKVCKVVWQRYLGVGKFDGSLWLMCPRHCISVSIEIGQILQKLWWNIYLVFMPHSVV